MEDLKKRHVWMEDQLRRQTGQVAALQRENAFLRDMLRDQQGAAHWSGG